MARPKARELTERELEVMQVFWDRGESTAADVREDVVAGPTDDVLGHLPQLQFRGPKAKRPSKYQS